MSLKVQPIYDRMVRQFTTSTQDKRFNQDFPNSFNDVLDELMVAGGLTTAIPHIETLGDTVDALDQNHTYIVCAGLTYHLTVAGYRKRDGTDTVFSEKEWNDRKGDFMVLKSQEDQATVDDDGVPTSDIIGLGYKSE